MSLGNAPSREKIIKDDGLGTWQWLKWFETIRKTLDFFISERYIATITGSTTLTDSNGTVVVATSGLTITLPAASTARIGRIWTVIFGTTGICTVQCSGSDSFPAVTSATETTLVITQRGESVVFQCTSATTWGLI